MSSLASAPSVDISKHTFKSPKFRSVVREAFDFFHNTPKLPLASPRKFNGPGVYALYYSGTLEHYKKISGKDAPIYIGKAVPSGWRQGRRIEGMTRTLA